MDWVIVSNSNNCRLFEHNKRPKRLNLLKELHFPSSRKKRIDLTADRPGRYATSTAVRGTYDEADAKEIEAEKFATKVARLIDGGRKKKSYNHLTVFAPAHMIGLINKHIANNLQNFANTIKKDYSHLSETEILDLLKPSGIAKPTKRKASKANL